MLGHMELVFHEGVDLISVNGVHRVDIIRVVRGTCDVKEDCVTAFHVAMRISCESEWHFVKEAVKMRLHVINQLRHPYILDLVIVISYQNTDFLAIPLPTRSECVLKVSEHCGDGVCTVLGVE